MQTNTDITELPKIGQPNRLDPKIILRVLWSIFRRRWLLIGLGLVISLAVGAVLSKSMNEKVWKATTVMLYTAPDVPDEIESLGKSLELSNMSGFANCMPVVDTIKERSGFGFPSALVSSSLNVETSRTTNTIFVSLAWGDKQEAVEILDQLTNVYPEYVANVRREIAQASLREVQSHLQTVQSKLDAASIRYQDFTRQNNIVDFKQDLILLQTKTLSLETKLDQIRRDEESMKDQIKILDDQINSIKAEEKEEAEANKEFEAATESLADNRRRQNRLRELIEEERRVVEVKAQIEVRRREYERAKKLFEKQLIPNSKLEKIRGELEGLLAKITKSESIIRWTKELTDLDKMVVPKNKVSKKGSPIISQILFKKLETELKIAHGQKGEIELDQQLKVCWKQIQSFQRVRAELASLDNEIQTINDNRVRLENQAAILEQMASLGPVEIAVVGPVSGGDVPISSNRKKLFVMIAFVGLVLSSSTIAAFDVLMNGIIPNDVQVHLMGLPVVAEVAFEEEELAEEPDEILDLADQPIPEASYSGPSRFEVEHHEAGNEVDVQSQLRLFALKLRQANSNYGCIAMLSSLNRGLSMQRTVTDLAVCLSHRDERVLVMDLRPAGDGLGEFVDEVCLKSIIQRATENSEEDCHREIQIPGIRDYLSFECDQLEEIVLPSKHAAVDFILPGVMRNEDQLATVRMSEVIDSIKSNYSIVLTLAPDPSNTTELQMLASHADVINFGFNPKLRLERNVGATIKELSDLGAPLMGAILIEN